MLDLIIYCFLVFDCDLEYICPKTECLVLVESELSEEILAYYKETYPAIEPQINTH